MGLVPDVTRLNPEPETAHDDAATTGAYAATEGGNVALAKSVVKIVCALSMPKLDKRNKTIDMSFIDCCEAGAKKEVHFLFITNRFGGIVKNDFSAFACLLDV